MSDTGPDIAYHPGAIPADAADRLLEALREDLAWEQHVVRIMGRQVPCPRLSAWYGDPGAVYTYSGLTVEPRPWCTALDEVRALAERTAGAKFNSVLANLYRDGADGMGWHADDERELGPEPIIASVSLGAPRRFVMRRRDDRACRHELVLAHGSVLLMRGDCQRRWHHCVPKTRRPAGPRINLTFRRILDPVAPDRAR